MLFSCLKEDKNENEIYQERNVRADGSSDGSYCFCRSWHNYARENNLNVVLRTTDAIGLPVDAFIPYFNLVVDGFEHSRKIKAVKKSLCNQNGITYCEINSKDPFAMAAQIKALFRKNHVYITSENENDIRFCRNLFFSVKRKNARTS